MKPQKVIVLGATGTIGRRTLDVLKQLQQSDPTWDCVGLACGSRVDRILEDAQKHWPAAKVASVIDDDRADFCGSDAALHLVEACASTETIVVSAIVGAAGLRPTLRAIELGASVALANKETLVCAGHLVQQALKSSPGTLWPVDSEHAAIAQCLRGIRSDQIKSIVLTASGGPFRDTPLSDLREVTPQQALNHPVWDMGPRITIDSATMANKALELIEAHHLFAVNDQRLEAIIHPTSLVHGMVHLCDGTTLLQMCTPDMAGPIRWALTAGEHDAAVAPTLNPLELTSLEFTPVDAERFPFVGLGFEVIRKGGGAGCVLNAADEVCVQAFLDGRLPYLDVYHFVAEAVDRFGHHDPSTLTDILELDIAVREDVANRIP